MSIEVPDGWVGTTLGELTEIVGGSTPSKANEAFWDGGSIPWATPSDVTGLPTGVLDIGNTRSHLTTEAVKAASLRVLPAGSVMMTSPASIGFPVINAVPMATNQGFANFLPNPSYEPRFLAQWCINNRKIFERMAGGSTFLEISKRSIRAIPIALPPIKEQRRIAEILSSVDEAIQATQAVIDQTRIVKQSVLERLLTKGIGHTRFKQSEIGEVPRSWSVMMLGDACSVQGGFAFKSNEFREEGIPLLRISNISDGVVRAEPGSPRIHEEYCERLHRFIVRKGDILMALSGATTGKWGVYDEISPAFLNQRVGRFLPKEILFEDFVPIIVEQLSSDVAKTAYGGAQPNISPRDIERKLLAIPPIDEQREISNRINRISYSISKSEALLATLMETKTRLSSNLLTGRVRIPADLLKAAE